MIFTKKLNFNIDIDILCNSTHRMSIPNSVRVKQMLVVQRDALELFRKKNADYGDSFATYGAVGVIIRMGDKIRRLSSVTKQGVSLIKSESIRDTLMDLHNYAAMAIMLLDEKEKAKPLNPDVLRVKTDNLSPYAESHPHPSLIRLSERAWKLHL